MGARAPQVKNLSQGASGWVQLCRDTRTGRLVAVKFIRRDKVTRYVQREILNHRSLHHPHVIEFREVRCCVLRAGGQGGPFMRRSHSGPGATAMTCAEREDMQVFLTPRHLGIAMEYAAGGDMFDYVVVRQKRLRSEQHARWFFQQLVVALDYCHRKVRGGLLGSPLLGSGGRGAVSQTGRKGGR